MHSDLFIGAYATSPTLANWNRKVERQWLQALNEHCGPIRGLELPFWGSGLHAHDDRVVLEDHPSEWKYAMTTVPAAWTTVSTGAPAVGLASRSHQGRQQAIAQMANARDAIARLCDQRGRACVESVHLASAPAVPGAPSGANADALAQSLDTISQWDWNGAQLTIEHCDSARPGRSPAKGFLPLTEELAAIKKVGADIGMVINWGRSAIEGRSAKTPLQHIEAARAAGALRGIMFSGTAARSQRYGNWTDLHLPVNLYEGESLLGEDEMAACIAAAGPDVYLGIKVLIQPMESAPLHERLRANSSTLRALGRAIQRARRAG